MPSRRSRVLSVLLFVPPLWACTGSGDDSTASQPSTSADAAASATPLDCMSDSGDWPMYGQNRCNTRVAAASDPITPGNVSKLKVKWTYAAEGNISATPAVVGGQLYVPDWGGMLHRINATSGAVVWSKAVADILGLSGDAGTLGDAETAADGAPLNTSNFQSFASPESRTTPIIADGNVIFTMGSLFAGATVAAIDKDTAELKWRSSIDEHPMAVITSSPVLDGDTIYLGVSSDEEAAPAYISGYPCCTFPRERRRAERDDRQDPVENVHDRRQRVLWERPQDTLRLCRRRDLEWNARRRSQARALVRHDGQQLRGSRRAPWNRPPQAIMWSRSSLWI